MASSMRSLKQKETIPEAPAPPPHWTSSISLFPIEKGFFLIQYKTTLTRTGVAKSQELNDEDHSSQNRTNFGYFSSGVGSRSPIGWI